MKVNEKSENFSKIITQTYHINKFKFKWTNSAQVFRLD